MTQLESWRTWVECCLCVLTVDVAASCAAALPRMGCIIHKSTTAALSGHPVWMLETWCLVSLWIGGIWLDASRIGQSKDKVAVCAYDYDCRVHCIGRYILVVLSAYIHTRLAVSFH